jgi:hypothetical protein
MLSHPLTNDDKMAMLNRALPLCPLEALQYTPLARTWLVRHGVPVYEIGATLVLRAIHDEFDRRVHLSVGEG